MAQQEPWTPNKIFLGPRSFLLLPSSLKLSSVKHHPSAPGATFPHQHIFMKMAFSIQLKLSRHYILLTEPLSSTPDQSTLRRQVPNTYVPWTHWEPEVLVMGLQSRSRWSPLWRWWGRRQSHSPWSVPGMRKNQSKEVSTSRAIVPQKHLAAELKQN